MSFSRETLSAFSDALGALYSEAEPAAALQAALPKLGALFDSRHAVIDELPHDGRAPIFHTALHLGEMGSVPSRYVEFVHEHPGAQVVRAGGFMPAHRISEFLTQREFVQTGLYQEIFRTIEARDQLCLAVRLHGSSLAVTLHRDAPFTADESYLGRLFQSHLAGAIADVREADRLRTRVANAEAWEIVFDADGAPHLVPEGFLAFCTPYFSEGRVGPGGLPDALWRWIRQQSSLLRTLGAQSPTVRAWLVEAPVGRLHLQLRPTSEPRGFVLHAVAERGAPNFFQLRAHGLTRRECEIVFWIAQGKRDAEIAGILGVATKTVSKHVENLLAKLGAETRLAAAHVAQQWLRRSG